MGSLDVSGFVRRARRLADLSQRELAAHIGRDQATVSRIEGGSGVSLRTFEEILAAAGLRLAVVDATGAAVSPMPHDVFRDGARRRQPAHLDVHARPEHPTVTMLLRRADPIPASGAWHHRRAERDRIRLYTDRTEFDEQLSVGAASARQQETRRQHAARRAGAARASPPRGARASPPIGPIGW